MELNKIQKQQLALTQISEYMAMVSQIAEVGHNAARLINKSFRAYQNKEIQDLINICYYLAKDNDLEYEVNIDSYDYDYTLSPNSHIYPMQHFILVLEYRYSEENTYLDTNAYNPLENEAMVKNELNNNYWDPDSETVNSKSQNAANYFYNSQPPYSRYDNDSMYTVSLKGEDVEYCWQSSGGTLC